MNLLEKEVISIGKISQKQYKKLQDFKITYFCDESPFGKCLVAFYEDQVCFLSFYDSSMDKCLGLLKKTFPKASFHLKEGFQPPETLNILLRGTDFEILVWTELLNVKKGQTVSYEHIAKAVGMPKATRAVANAIGRNNIAYIVPCHRVIRKNGELGGFGCGPHRKMKMLKYEGARI